MQQIPHKNHPPSIEQISQLLDLAAEPSRTTSTPSSQVRSQLRKKRQKRNKAKK